MSSSRSNSKSFRKVFDMANGSTLGISLPKEITVKLSIRHGDYVQVIQDDERIVVEKVE